MKTNQEIVEGRNERILAADLNQRERRDRGLPPIPRRQVKGAEWRKEGRLDRLAGTVHDHSSGDQPKNWFMRRVHSAEMSGKKRIAGKPSPRIAPKNRDRKIITNSFNHGLDEGQKRNRRIVRADINKHGYTELARRSDPKRTHVVKAQDNELGRMRRLAGIVPGSANARPENRSDVLIHSARMSGAKTMSPTRGPSPRIAPKNRDRKIITNSFNHGLDEGKLRNTRIQKKYPHTNLARQANTRTTERRNRIAGIVPGSFKVPSERAHVLKLSNKISHWKEDGGFSNGMNMHKIKNRTPRKNRDRKIITNSFNHGLDEGRYERLRDADIKKHGYTELAGRSDPKRSDVYKAQTRAIGRARRVAGIVPGSANAQPINISNILSRSARKSAEARFAGKPSPRIPPKNRNRKIITNSFNHGLEEAKRPIKQSKNILGAAVRGAIRGITTPKPAGTSGVKHVVKGAVKGAMRNIARHIVNKFL